MSHNNYDAIARYYDVLAMLVFGYSLRRAQTDQLHYLKDNDTLLIAGGGTGWILEKIQQSGRKNLRVFFVDASAQMIRLAQKRKTPALSVRFLQTKAENIADLPACDLIMTPFLFDNFEPEQAAKLFNHLHPFLRTGGVWLHADFHLSTASPWWQKKLLAVMYYFFRATAAVSTRTLTDMTPHFERYAYRCANHKNYYKNFIQAFAWIKTT